MGDWANEVVCAGNVEKIEVGQVADGTGDRVGFGEVEVGDVEVVDSVCLGIGVAGDTLLGFAAVGGWEPGRESDRVTKLFLDLKEGFFVLWVA